MDKNSFKKIQTTYTGLLQVEQTNCALTNCLNCLEYFKKIQTTYTGLLQVEQTICALTNCLNCLEYFKIDKADKHLLKDLKQHKNRLEVKRKEINEYLNNKDAYENSLPSNPESR